LPGDVRGFVNRLSDLERLDEALAVDEPRSTAASTCVIVGTAGVGKTSLAVHWAHRVSDRFPDGQLYVNLRGYDPGAPIRPEQALDGFLRSLGVTPGAVPADLEARAALYRSLLAGRRFLIVLDNAATTTQVRPLLPGTSDSLTLVTSRNLLSGLIARDGARRVAVKVLAEPEAVMLLHDVTVAYRKGDNADEIAELARLCARLPLALRIAAERAAARPQMPLRELIRDLRDESELWDVLSSGDDEEADAVRTVFSWSYRTLAPDAARLFRLLGLHPGPEFGILAAAALAGVSIKRVRQWLDTLVGAHLVEHVASDRYQFHDLLRAYAGDRAQHEETSESRSDALNRLLAWYLHSATGAAIILDTRYRIGPLSSATANPVPLTFDDRNAAVRWFESEWLNLHAAAFAAYQAGLDDYVWRLPAAFRSYYEVRNSFDGRLEIASLALAGARRMGNRFGEGESLFTLAVTYGRSHQPNEALEAYSAALQIWRELDDRIGEAMALNSCAVILQRLRRFEDALAQFERAAGIFREAGNRRWEGEVLSNLGRLYLDLGRSQDAAPVLGTAVEMQRDSGSPLYTADTLVHFARARLELGDIEGASIDARTAIEAARESDSAVFEATCLLILGTVQLAAGLPAEALRSFQQCAILHREHGDRVRESEALDSAGMALAELGRPDEATDLHRTAASTFRELGHPWLLAVALEHLATTLAQSGIRDGAVEAWREASALLAGFDDPKAVERRSRVTQALQGVGGHGGSP
jgi:tetratricopeptide (TPR) repeat protein